MARLLEWFVIAISLLAVGCQSVGYDYERPGVAVPDAWTVQIAPHLENDAACLAEWWKGFGDEALDCLIVKALEENPSFEVARQRVVEARARRGVALSAIFPTMESNGAYTRRRQSANTGTGFVTRPEDVYSIGVETGWEIDLFGGLRRGVEAAEAEIEASVEDYRDLLVTLLADVATNYIDYRTFEERIRVANQNIAIQTDSLSLAQSRLDAGLVSRIDVTQAEANLETTRALVPQLEGQRLAARNRLATLTGGFPHSVVSILANNLSIPMPSRNFAVGEPADLLRTRPDVRRAERALAAEVARIGVAEADLYPRFSLAGSLTLEANDISTVPDFSSASYGFGPSFRWNLFSSGQIKNLIRAQEARAMQAYKQYENAVLLAVEDAETSLASVATERARLASLRRAVHAASESVDLVKSNYTEGLVDFQRVIDSERVKFQNEDRAVTSRGTIARSYVALYRALGGGASLAEVELSAPKKKPGGGWIIKRPAPYAEGPKRDPEKSEAERADTSGDRAHEAGSAADS